MTSYGIYMQEEDAVHKLGVIDVDTEEQVFAAIDAYRQDAADIASGETQWAIVAARVSPDTDRGGTHSFIGRRPATKPWVLTSLQREKFCCRHGRYNGIPHEPAHDPNRDMSRKYPMSAPPSCHPLRVMYSDGLCCACYKARKKNGKK